MAARTNVIRVLAADQSAQATNVGIEHLEIGRVALAPKHPLRERGHGLAVPAHQATRAIENRSEL